MRFVTAPRYLSDSRHRPDFSVTKAEPGKGASPSVRERGVFIKNGIAKKAIPFLINYSEKSEKKQLHLSE